jgi:hypothetical protein
MDNYPYCSIRYCPAHTRCQTQEYIQTMLLAQSDDMKLLQNHCQSIVMQYCNPQHPHLYAQDFEPLTPLELYQKYNNA